MSEPFPFEMPEVPEPDKRKALVGHKGLWVIARNNEVTLATLQGKLSMAHEAGLEGVTLTKDEILQALLALNVATNGILLRKFGVITDE